MKFSQVKSYFLLIGFSFLISCSASKDEQISYDNFLLKEKITSNSKLFTISSPKKWFVAQENKTNSKDIWLIKDDYSSSITINPISVENNFTTFEDVLKFLKISKQVSDNPSKIENLEFNSRITTIAGFKYTNSIGNLQTILLVYKNSRIFEAFLSEKTLNQENLNTLLAICNSLE